MSVQQHRQFPWHILFFIAPGLLIYVTFSVYPLLDTLWLGFFQETESGQRVFAGLDNYRTLLVDAVWSEPFWNALWNNTKFFLIHMLVQNPIGLFLAALLSSPKLRLRNTYRTLMSRGMKGCYVHFEDRDTQRFFRSRMEVERAAMVAEPGQEYGVE